MSEKAALHNEVITTKIYDPMALLNAPILPALAAMINSSFAAHFAPFVSPAVLNGTQRINSPNELAEDITPDGFTVVAFSPSSPDTPIATASVKVYYNDKFWEDWGDARRLKLKQWKEENKDAVYTQWEITAVAVRYSPEYLKKGLATHVVNVVAEELKRRLLASQKQTDGELKTIVRVVKEINGDYWLKKGFVLVEETVIPAGILGTELTNWDMEKTLRLDDY
ncbi:hypothetical protein V1520DRAFT_344803 [Lipomyces starkeyi]|uniref:N-acetyltransferase domain-containing protein n=1 Tax=Lipomyces starkeyi NRRL Y-11557 TaxID=675824 RepID=A0A1E3Q273_LIPST|nr:hypothetical protein LIPSTDRAFT_73497 [Lipomyces starkeyi NRRL Y-11557]